MLLHEDERTREGRPARNRARPACSSLGLSISLDELAIGFTIGLLHLSLWLAIVLIGAQAFIVAQLGLEARRTSQRDDARACRTARRARADRPCAPPRRREAALTNPRLLRRGLRLEYATLAWNVVGSVLVVAAAVAAHSVALAGFGLDSLIEIVASVVVVWQLKGTGKARGKARERKALRLVGYAFVLLALYIGAQSIYVLLARLRPHHSPIGIAWLAMTAVAMFALAYGKSTTGRALDNRVLETEARVTAIDGLLAVPFWSGSS